VLATSGRWPGPRSLYCLQFSARQWPRAPEIVDHVPVLSCERRGATIDLLLDRARNNRSQLVFTTCRGREAVFWQSARSRDQYRVRPALPAASAAGIARMEVFVDDREKDAYTFAYHPVSPVRHRLACGDYAVATDGRVTAAVERKSLPDLTNSMSDRRLEYAMADLAHLPRAAVVVEDRYEQLYNIEHLRESQMAQWVARLQVRHPNVPIVFPGTRGLAEEWTFRFLAAARQWALDEEAAGQRMDPTHGWTQARKLPPSVHSPDEHVVRLWARSVGLPVGEYEPIRPGLWAAWRRTHPHG
jgi:hypothetical protein